MGRVRRSDVQGRWFHVVNRGAARQAIFEDDRDRIEFGRLLGVLAERFDVRTHAYCLMGNHYHLLLESPESNLSEAMHVLGSVFVRHHNERVGRDGPLFRDRFFSSVVATEEYFLRVVRYIHRNPLAFLPPDQLETYRWSSLRTYLGYRRAPDWLERKVLLGMVDGPEGIRRDLFDPPTDGVVAEPADWASAIDCMIDEHLPDAPSQGVSSTIVALLRDVVPRAGVPVLDELAAYPTVNAERSAASRARRRAGECPELAVVARAVLDLVA